MLNEEKIISKLITHDEFLKQVATKEDVKNSESRIINGQDQIIGMLNRIDEERTFTVERVRKTEEEIRQIKMKLQIA